MEKTMVKEYSWKLDYRVKLGDVYTRFFEGLKDKKILGNKCGKCGRIYIPPKPFCDICFVEPTEWLEAEHKGTVTSFTVCYQKFENLPEPPYISGIIKIGNSAISFVHFIGGIECDNPKELPSKIKIGMEVEPVWAPERVGDMLDIEYFKPVK